MMMHSNTANGSANDLDHLNSSLDPTQLGGVNSMDDLLTAGLDADDLASFLSATDEPAIKSQQSDNNNPNSDFPSPIGDDVAMMGDYANGNAPDGESPDKAGMQQCVCPECGKVFNSVWYLKQHAVKHSNDRPFKCKFCGKTYKFRSNLYQHKCPERVRLQGPRVPRRRKLQRAPQLQETHRDSPASSSGGSGASSTSPGVNQYYASAPHVDANVAQNGGMHAVAHMQQQQPQQQPHTHTEMQPMAVNAPPPYHQHHMVDQNNGMLSPKQEYTMLSPTRINTTSPYMQHHMGGYPGQSPVKSTPSPVEVMPSVSDEYAQEFIQQHKNELHVCRRCKPPTYFPSREYLCRHMSWHSEHDGRHACSQCAETFGTERQLCDHRTLHAVQSAYKCTSCNGIFKSPLGVRRHYAASARCNGYMPRNDHHMMSLNAPSDPYAFIHQPSALMAPPQQQNGTGGVRNPEEDEELESVNSTSSPIPRSYSFGANGLTNGPPHSDRGRIRNVVTNALAALDSGVGSSTSGGDVDSSPGTGGSLADSVELGYTAAGGGMQYEYSSGAGLALLNNGLSAPSSSAPVSVPILHPSSSTTNVNHNLFAGDSKSDQNVLFGDEMDVNDTAERNSHESDRLEVRALHNNTTCKSSGGGGVAIQALCPVRYHQQNAVITYGSVDLLGIVSDEDLGSSYWADDSSRRTATLQTLDDAHKTNASQSLKPLTISTRTDLFLTPPASPTARDASTTASSHSLQTTQNRGSQLLPKSPKSTPTVTIPSAFTRKKSNSTTLSQIKTCKTKNELRCTEKPQVFIDVAKCVFCGKMFTNEQLYRIHMKWHQK